MITVHPTQSCQPSSLSAHLPQKIVHRPEDLLSTWQLTLQKVSEVTIQIFVAIVFIVIANALLPLPIKAVVLPFIALGSVFITAFMFISKPETPQIVPISQVRPMQVQPVLQTDPLLPAEAPRGLVSNSNSINSLEQVLRADRGLMNLFQNLPEPLIHFSIAAQTLPREIVFNSTELALHPITANPSNPTFPHRSLPTNFAAMTEVEKAAEKQVRDQETFEWILQIPEFVLEPLHSISFDRIFSEIPIEELLPDGSFNHFLESERVFRKRNAKECIEKLRLIESERKDQLGAIISSVVEKRPEENGASIQRPESSANGLEDEKQAFRQRLATYRNGVRLIKLFKDKNIVSEDLMKWQSVGENSQVEEINWLKFLNEDDRVKALKLIKTIKGDPQLLSLFESSIELLKAIAPLTESNRSDILRYLTIFHSANSRAASLKFFIEHKRFFSDYDAARTAHKAIVENVDSSTLHSVFQANSLNSQPGEFEQYDPLDALDLITRFLPSDLSVSLINCQTYRTQGLPPIADSQDGIRTKVERNPGFLKLDIGKSPDLAIMLEHFFDHPVSGNPVQIKDKDGVSHSYPIEREQNRFELAPKSLWLPIKRFKCETPAKGSLWNPFNWFSAPQLPVQTRIDTPVILPATLKIPTLKEGIAEYKLDGFIVHVGLSANTRHYKSYTLEHNSTGEVWYETDDANVREVKEEELTRLKSQAYIPHYSKIELASL